MARKRTVAIVCGALAATVGLAIVPQIVGAVTVINMDLVVQGSECLGIDCPVSPAFGFDTLRLQENNLRIKFDDTSSTASFPFNDWELTINDSTNGGQSRFSVTDITAGATPFTIEAGAANNSLYVDDNGRLGIKTATPVVELHMRDGNTPTMRLEQDGSAGFTQQTWDVAGNEAVFFIRDVTNGSRLPFKIQPSAPTDSMFISSSGRIGLRNGTAAPGAPLHIQAGDPGIGNSGLLIEREGGPVAFQIKDKDTSGFWNMSMADNATAFSFSRNGTGAVEFSIKESGVVRYRTLATAPATAEVGDVYVDSDGGFCVAYAANTWTNIRAAGNCT